MDWNGVNRCCLWIIQLRSCAPTESRRKCRSSGSCSISVRWPTANQHDESRRDASVTRTITSTFRRLLFPFRLFSIRNRFGLVLHVSRTPVVAQFKTTEQISLIAGQGVSCWRTKGARARPLFDCWDVKKRKFQTEKKTFWLLVTMSVVELDCLCSSTDFVGCCCWFRVSSASLGRTKRELRFYLLWRCLCVRARARSFLLGAVKCGRVGSERPYSYR